MMEVSMIHSEVDVNLHMHDAVKMCTDLDG